MLFALFVISVLVLTSCTSVNSGRGGSSISSGDGLSLRFDYAPSRIYSGDGLELSLEYSNYGDHDIVDGKFVLSGYDSSFISLSPNPVDFEIDGKDPAYNIPVTQTQLFSASHVRMPQNTEQFDQTIKLSACYTYATHVQANICIDPNPDSVEDKTCRTTQVDILPQSAPIKVTGIEVNTRNNRAIFKIDISNVGSGDVFNPDDIYYCPSRLERDVFDKVDVINAKFSGHTLSCDPGNPVRLVNGHGFVYCSYEGNLGVDAYQTVLTLDVQYGYRQTLTHSLRVDKTFN